MQFFKKYSSLLLILSILGCTKPVDFNQIDNAEVDAEYLATFVYFEQTAPKFLDSLSKEIKITTNEFDNPFRSLNSNYLDSIAITINTDNTFNRNFDLTVSFLNPTYLLPTIIIPANSSNNKKIISIQNSDINKVFSAKNVRFTLVMSPSLDGSTLNITDLDTLSLKSSVNLFYKFRKI